MLRTLLTASLLLAWCLPAQATIIQYRGSDGRLYYSNRPAVSRPQRRPESATAQTPPVSPKRAPILRLVNELARHHHVEPQLVLAIIRAESDFDPHAVSRAGAQGLMQLMPATAERYRVVDPFDPRDNITGGIRYLKELLRRFPGDLRQVLAAYHAGEGAVQRYGGIPPYSSTQHYVKRVMAFYGKPTASRKIYRYRTANGSILLTDTPR